MLSIFIVAENSEKVSELRSGLRQAGFACSVASNREDFIEQMIELTPDLVLLESGSHSGIKTFSQLIKQGRKTPVIALVHREMLSNINGHFDLVDDLIIQPYDLKELEFRVQRLLHRTRADSSEIIKCGDLVIDMAGCEVTLAGKPIDLTFREYELLKFLVTNRGRVYTREDLLNKVWGYDYYGGDRTVDVHIRTLRKKLRTEAKRIVTVKNYGYRFEDED